MKKDAKKGMLKGLSDQMREMMGEGYEGMKDMKKVTVASPTEEGLEEGLDKAKEILKKKLGEDAEMEESEEREEKEEMSKEDIQEKIEKLQKLLEDME